MKVLDIELKYFTFGSSGYENKRICLLQTLIKILVSFTALNFSVILCKY